MTEKEKIIVSFMFFLVLSFYIVLSFRIDSMQKVITAQTHLMGKIVDTIIK